jgi:hypothetical protein
VAIRYDAGGGAGTSAIGQLTPNPNPDLSPSPHPKGPDPIALTLPLTLTRSQREAGGKAWAGVHASDRRPRAGQGRSACQAERGAERANPPGELQVGCTGDEHDQDGDAQREGHEKDVAGVGESEVLRCKERFVQSVVEGACDWAHRDVRSRRVAIAVTPQGVAFEECRLSGGACATRAGG